MSWEEDVFAFLDDLEHQASALWDADRAPELADRSRAEYQVVSLASRLMASLDTEVVVEIVGVGAVRGVLDRVASGWCVLTTPVQDWVVHLGAVQAVEGAATRSVPEVAWPVVTRLGLGSALRRLGEAGERCVVHRRDGARHDGQLRRVGADFVEVDAGADAGHRITLVAFEAIAAVQSRE